MTDVDDTDDQALFVYIPAEAKYLLYSREETAVGIVLYIVDYVNWVYGTSTLVGYSMANHSYTYDIYKRIGCR